MCNNMSLFRVESVFFFEHLDPSEIRFLKKQKHLTPPKTPQKHLKTWWGVQ